MAKVHDRVGGFAFWGGLILVAAVIDFLLMLGTATVATAEHCRGLPTDGWECNRSLGTAFLVAFLLMAAVTAGLLARAIVALARHWSDR